MLKILTYGKIMKEFIPPKLPLDIELNANIYGLIIRASRKLAELNGLSKSMPNPNILINALILQEAKDSSEIENIITTHDELFYLKSMKVNLQERQKK